MEKNKIAWQAHPGKQTLALKCNEFEILYGGARGGGKTEGGMAWLLRPFVDYDENLLKYYRALILRKNAKDLHDWLDRARRFYLPVKGKVIGNPPEIRFPSGTKFVTGHLSDPGSYIQYVGHEYQRMLIEELTQIPSEELYLKVLSSCRTTNKIQPQIFCTTNPGGQGHSWVMKRWNIKGSPPYKINKFLNRIFIPSTVEDNPSLTTSDPQYLKFLDNLPEPLKSAWRKGDWSVFAGQYFVKYSSVIHGIKPFIIPDSWDIFGGLDFGTTNPTAFGIYTRNTNDNSIIRIGEYYRPGLTAIENARNIYQYCIENKYTKGRLPEIVYSDPSMWIKTRLQDDFIGADAPSDQFINIGLNLEKANNDRINGWRICNELLDWNENKNPSFYYFIGENDNFEEYIPQQLYDEKNKEDLKKCDIDHVADEWRYAMIMTNTSIVKINMDEDWKRETRPLSYEISHEEF